MHAKQFITSVPIFIESNLILIPLFALNMVMNK